MDKKKCLMVTTLILLVFRATTTMGFSSPNQVLLGTGSAAVAAGQTPCELFDGLLLVVNDTKQEVEAIVYNLPENSEELDSLKEDLQSATETFNEAIQLNQTGFCEEASIMLSKALHELGEIASEALEHGAEDDDTYESAVEALEIKEKIERAYEILSTIRITVNQLEAMGLNVTLVVDLLSETEETLLQAKNASEANDFERGEDLLSDVEDLFDEAYDRLEEINRPKTFERVTNFLNTTKERMGTLESRIMEILNQANASQDVLDLVGTAFQEVYVELEDIDQSIYIDDLDDILEDLDDLFDEIEDAYEILGEEMEEAGEYLEELVEYEALIDHLEKKLTELDGAGFNVTVLSSMLENAESIFRGVQESFEQGDFEELDEQLDYLDEILDDIEDEVEDMMDDDDGDDEDEVDMMDDDDGDDEDEVDDDDSGDEADDDDGDEADDDDGDEADDDDGDEADDDSGDEADDDSGDDADDDDGEDDSL
jgi:tetratricopeptide (TPR) repeat protein